MKNGLDKSCGENQNSTFFSPENRTVYEIMSKNVVDTEGPQMTSQYGACALHAGKARLHALTLMHTPTLTGNHTHTHTDQ